jgi:hypothetical protein
MKVMMVTVTMATLSLALTLILTLICNHFSLDATGYYNSVKDCVIKIGKKEGIRAFYLSLPTTLMMNIPYGCVMVAANESARKILNPKGGYNIGSSMLAG